MSFYGWMFGSFCLAPGSRSGGSGDAMNWLRRWFKSSKQRQFTLEEVRGITQAVNDRIDDALFEKGEWWAVSEEGMARLKQALSYMEEDRAERILEAYKNVEAKRAEKK